MKKLWVYLWLSGFFIGYLLGQNRGYDTGVSETKALWHTQAFSAPEEALWDKSTYDKAVADEVERQKEMQRGR